MSNLEIIGFMWVALSTAVFSAVVLIAAGTAAYIGAMTLWERYQAGAALLRTLTEVPQQNINPHEHRNR